MPVFIHNRTGRQVSVADGIASRYRTPQWTEQQVAVPTGTVAELLAWAGTDPSRRAAVLAAEVSGKNRKSLIEALS